LSISDVGTRQMQKPYVVAHLLIPADQYAPEAIHPDFSIQ
jgi:hypothetical protein